MAMASSTLLTRASTHFLKPLFSSNLLHLSKATARSVTTTPFEYPDHLRDKFESYDFKKHPYMVAGPVKPCNIKEDEDAMYVRLDMPGISKQGLELCVKNGSTLCVMADEGESKAKYMAEEERVYVTTIRVPPEKYRPDQMKAMLMNGVLRVVVPKVKEESSDTSHIIAANVTEKKNSNTVDITFE